MKGKEERENKGENWKGGDCVSEIRRVFFEVWGFCVRWETHNLASKETGPKYFKVDFAM